MDLSLSNLQRKNVPPLKTTKQVAATQICAIHSICWLWELSPLVQFYTLLIFSSKSTACHDVIFISNCQMELSPLPRAHISIHCLVTDIAANICSHQQSLLIDLCLTVYIKLLASPCQQYYMTVCIELLASLHRLTQTVYIILLLAVLRRSYRIS